MRRKYVCVRCGYETEYKSSMHNHFYRKKKPCPMMKTSVELTEEVKEHILTNHVYLLPSESNNIITNINTINNFNTINNLITNMDTINKITKYVDYKQIELKSFENRIETKYEKHAKKLKDDLFKYGFELSGDDFLDIINEISNIFNHEHDDCVEDFNILYDNKLNRLKLYEQGAWEEMLLSNGLKQIVRTIQAYYLNSYEIYLIKGINNPLKSAFKRQQCKELLEEYYRFIGALDVPACIAEIDVSEFSQDCIDVYWSLYVTTRDNLKRSDINHIKKEVTDILKRNTIKNIDEMNKKVLELFHVDECFKKDIMKTTISWV